MSTALAAHITDSFNKAGNGIQKHENASFGRRNTKEVLMQDTNKLEDNLNHTLIILPHFYAYLEEITAKAGDVTLVLPPDHTEERTEKPKSGSQQEIEEYRLREMYHDCIVAPLERTGKEHLLRIVKSFNSLQDKLNTYNGNSIFVCDMLRARLQANNNDSLCYVLNEVDVNNQNSILHQSYHGYTAKNHCKIIVPDDETGYRNNHSNLAFEIPGKHEDLGDGEKQSYFFNTELQTVTPGFELYNKVTHDRINDARWRLRSNPNGSVSANAFAATACDYEMVRVLNWVAAERDGLNDLIAPDLKDSLQTQFRKEAAECISEHYCLNDLVGMSPEDVGKIVRTPNWIKKSCM